MRGRRAVDGLRIFFGCFGLDLELRRGPMVYGGAESSCADLSSGTWPSRDQSGPFRCGSVSAPPLLSVKPRESPCHRRGQMFGYFTFIYGIYVARTNFNKNVLLAITSTRHPRKSVHQGQSLRRNGGILAQLRLKSNSAIRNTKNGEPQSIIWRTR